MSDQSTYAYWCDICGRRNLPAHFFPNCIRRQNEWASLLGWKEQLAAYRSESKSVRNVRVCLAHFSNQQFKYGIKPGVLTEEAVPDVQWQKGIADSEVQMLPKVEIPRPNIPCQKRKADSEMHVRVQVAIPRLDQWQKRKANREVRILPKVAIPRMPIAKKISPRFSDPSKFLYHLQLGQLDVLLRRFKVCADCGCNDVKRSYYVRSKQIEVNLVCNNCGPWKWYSAGAPVQQNSAGAPVQQHAAGAPVQQHAAGAPVQQNSAGAPVQQNSEGAPCQQNCAGAPVQQNSAGAPVQQTAVNSSTTAAAVPPTLVDQSTHLNKTGTQKVENDLQEKQSDFTFAEDLLGMMSCGDEQEDNIEEDMSNGDGSSNRRTIANSTKMINNKSAKQRSSQAVQKRVKSENESTTSNECFEGSSHDDPVKIEDVPPDSESLMGGDRELQVLIDDVDYDKSTLYNLLMATEPEVNDSGGNGKNSARVELATHDRTSRTWEGGRTTNNPT